MQKDNELPEAIGKLTETPKVCVVLPTYNESGNIRKMLDLIFLNEEPGKADVHVLVVDDSSPDGTADIVRAYQKKNPRVHLLNRTRKEGLGAAYIAGFKHALSEISPEILFEMDADLSHNPSYMPAMIETVKKGADFVIGSRYVEGGSVPDEWGMNRKLISKTANLYTKTMLHMDGVKDCTGGFRAIRSAVFDRVDLDSLDVKGYAFQISLLYDTIQNGYTVKEVPIAFADRAEGKSKMSMSDMLELAVTVLKIRRRKQHRQ